METEIKKIKTEKSKVVWKGHKVTGSHEGTINVKSGFLTFQNDNLIGGEIIIDMATIVSTDLSGEFKQKLEGHLKTDDFFGVENFPTATLIFKEVQRKGENSYTVSADLTIKGKTNPITFEMLVVDNKATTSLQIDRTDYDVKFGSSRFFNDLQDKAIDDKFELITDLEF